MREIDDRQLTKVLLPVGVASLLCIAFVFFTGTNAVMSYTDEAMQDLCHVEEPRDWQYIVLHHSGTAGGNAAEFDRSHREDKGWDEMGYHFVIGNGQRSRDGKIEIRGRWTSQKEGAHAGVLRYNQQGIGICLVGDFSESDVTRAQYESLLGLCTYLMRTFEIPLENIVKHCDIRATECPGTHFPFDTFLADLSAPPAILQGEQ